MKKKLLITFLTVALFSSVFSIVTLAEAVPVEVRAAESWTNATYDPENNILTNIVIDETDPDNPVDRSYSFTWVLGSNKIEGCKTLYTLDKNTNDFPPDATDVVLPSSITYEGETYYLTTIDQNIFGVFGKKANTITKIVVSEGYTAIPSQFAAQLKNLKTVYFEGETITSIGQDAFNSCSSITSMNLPKSLTTLATGAFGSAKLPSTFEILWRVTEIPNNLFKGKIGTTHMYFKGNITSFGNSVFSQGWSSGVKNIYFEGATSPEFGTDILHNNFKTNLTVWYPANRASYANFENDFRVASGVYVVVDGIATSEKTDSTNTAEITFAKIPTSSSIINDVYYDVDLNTYRVDYNIIIGEADWEANPNAVAFIALYNGNSLIGVKSVSVTDTSSSETFNEGDVVPTSAKLFVWSDSSNTIKPLIPSATYIIE